jgi:hypothetical protein
MDCRPTHLATLTPTEPIKNNLELPADAASLLVFNMANVPVLIRWGSDPVDELDDHVGWDVALDWQDAYAIPIPRGVTSVSLALPSDSRWFNSGGAAAKAVVQTLPYVTLWSAYVIAPTVSP